MQTMVFSPFAFTVPSNKSWQTSKLSIPVLVIASLTTHAGTKHQVSTYIQAKPFILLNSRVNVNSVNSLQEGFQSKNLKFDTDTLLVITEMWLNP